MTSRERWVAFAVCLAVVLTAMVGAIQTWLVVNYGPRAAGLDLVVFGCGVIAGRLMGDLKRGGQ